MVLLVMLYRQLLTSSLVFAVQTVLEAGPGGVSGYGGAATMMVQLVSDRLCYGDCLRRAEDHNTGVTGGYYQDIYK